MKRLVTALLISLGLLRSFGVRTEWLMFAFFDQFMTEINSMLRENEDVPPLFQFFGRDSLLLDVWFHIIKFNQLSAESSYYFFWRTSSHSIRNIYLF